MDLKEFIKYIIFPLTMTGIGLIVLIIYSSFYPENQFSILGGSILVSGASLLSGGLLGFLFGVPRTIYNENNNYPQKESESEIIQANTNLEQISDWLTKILVGVGLTQIKPILHYIYNKIILRVAPAFGSKSEGDIGMSITIGAVVYFFNSGFFLGYLWSRIYLTIGLKNNFYTELKETRTMSNKIHLIRQLIDSVPNYNSFTTILEEAKLSKKLEEKKGNAKVQIKEIFILFLNNVTDKDEINIPPNIDDFLDDILKDISVENQNKKYPFLRAVDYQKLGNILTLEDRYDDAIKLYDQSLKLNPFSYYVLNIKGLALFKKGELKKADAFFKIATEVDNNLFEAWSNRSLVIIQEIIHKKYDEKNDTEKDEYRYKAKKALLYANKAILLNSNKAQTFLNKGNALYCLEAVSDNPKENYEESNKAFKKAKEIDDSFWQAWYNLACNYSIHNEFEEAIQCLKEAITINPKVTEIISKEPDFNNIKSNNDFKELLKM